MSSPPSPAHADSVSFLLSQLGGSVAGRFADEVSAAGLTPRAYGVLSLLTDGHRPTQQQLADSLGIHRNNMVGIIDELEAAGWVERQRDPADRRAFRIRLTSAGATMAATGARIAASLDTSLCAGLTAAEVRTLGSLLARLAQDASLPRGQHPAMRR